MVRVVNIDWLEVYVLESSQKYPCNADYFRSKGYFVKERDYGTRTYKEMFTIEDENGNPWIEVRRNPASGDADFVGLVPESCHLRLTNRACYENGCVEKLRQFLLMHDYIFKRIYRIDICYDFKRFDYGDDPARFCRRYLDRTYAKINQCKVAAFGIDNWASFDWESISWGNPKSMVSTKIYNKTKELAATGDKKPYIKYAWFIGGLVDDPINLTSRDPHGKIVKEDVWRIEFSMKSTSNRWIKIEDSDAKGFRKLEIPHTLELFDAPDKLWHRFQDLAHHYFRFKIVVRKQARKGIAYRSLTSIRKYDNEDLQRKDRCPDKNLFRWDKGHEFLRLDTIPRESKQSYDDRVLLKRLQQYKMVRPYDDIPKACQTIIDDIMEKEAYRVSPKHLSREARILQLIIKARLEGDERSIPELYEYYKPMVESKMIF